MEWCLVKYIKTLSMFNVHDYKKELRVIVNTRRVEGTGICEPLLVSSMAGATGLSAKSVKQDAVKRTA
jgi:hypothetical protein